MCVRDRLAYFPGGDRRKACLAWRPRDPNLRNGQQLGSNISSSSLFFGVPEGSLAHRYTSSLWGLLEHCDGAFFHFHSASQPRGHIFPSIASWSGIHTRNDKLSLPLAANFCIRSAWHDTRLILSFTPLASCLAFTICTLDMASGPPSISPMGYAPNDPRRGNALYGRHEEPFARQYATLPNLLA